jgi:hypothetical protein
VRGRRVSLIFFLAASVGAVAFSGCGSGSSGTTSTEKEATAPATTAPAKKEEHASPPSGPVAPSKTLVTIAAAPKGAGVISGAEFDRGMMKTASIRSLKEIPKPGSEEYVEMKNEVLDNLIITVWLEGQAEELGIEISDAERAQALQGSGMLGLLQERIESKLRRQAPNPSEPQPYFSEIDREFEAKWPPRTHCARGFIVQQCGNYHAAANSE